MRTEGVQEALLKIKDIPNAPRIAKIKQVLKAVSLNHNIFIMVYYFYYLSYVYYFIHDIIKDKLNE